MTCQVCGIPGNDLWLDMCQECEETRKSRNLAKANEILDRMAVEIPLF